MEIGDFIEMFQSFKDSKQQFAIVVTHHKAKDSYVKLSVSSEGYKMFYDGNGYGQSENPDRPLNLFQSDDIDEIIRKAKQYFSNIVRNYGGEESFTITFINHEAKVVNNKMFVRQVVQEFSPEELAEIEAKREEASKDFWATYNSMVGEDRRIS